LATRAEVIEEEVKAWHARQAKWKEESPWYASVHMWEALLLLGDVVADIAVGFSRPGVATVARVTTSALRQKVITKSDMTSWIRYKLQLVNTQLENTKKNSKEATRLDAQLELLLELLGEKDKE